MSVLLQESHKLIRVNDASILHLTGAMEALRNTGGCKRGKHELIAANRCSIATNLETAR